MSGTDGPREPAIRAPWPALALALIILGGFLLQRLSGDPAAAYDRFGFSPGDLARGRWTGLVTALFVHGSWGHAGMNALMALAFGAPVARLFGTRPGGALAFFAFYIGCGVLASLGFAWVEAGVAVLLVGASGAVSGLMGAASRLLVPSGRGLAPLLSGPVIGMAVGWVVVNLLIAVSGLSVGSGGAPVAWQAHLFGYAAGLLCIGPLARLLHRT